MATTINIQDFNVSKTAVKVQLYMQYIFSAVDGNVEVMFLSASDEILKQENVYIPSDVYSEWTTSDVIIEDYVLNQLGLERDS